MPRKRSRDNWIRTTPDSPCPICRKSDWCRITADGTLAGCMRVEQGSFRAKDGTDGSRVYLHRLADGPRPEADLPPRHAGPEAKRADNDTLHEVYTDLLGRLALNKVHRDALEARGLTGDAIDQGGYRSLPVQGRARIVRGLRDRFGDKLLGAPGIVVKNGKNGPFLTLRGPAGLLVPCRDRAGRIVALKVRRDEVGGENESRYLYCSSAGHGGPSPGAPVHCPMGTPETAELVRLTEGELKADVIQARTGLPTISVPGVCSWKPALAVLKSLGCKTVRLAFDADILDNANVARALTECADALVAAGQDLELERWDIADGKGLDDLLSAGKVPEVLTGEAALVAIHEALATATAGEPPPEPSPLDRLAALLAEKGAEAIYRDEDLLRALAHLAESDPAEFACHRAQLQRAGVKLRDLDRAIAPLRQKVRQERPPVDAAGCYHVSGGRIVREVLTKDGPVEVLLATWSGRIVDEVVSDDGVDQSFSLAIEGSLADGTPLPRVEVPAEQWPLMRWPVERWGTRAVVMAGASTADHLRCALQLLSGDVPRRTIYKHTGWRNLGDRWVYLHAGGAIGADGVDGRIEVVLPEALANYSLPNPPTGRAQVDAIQASLRVLDLAPDRITVPLLGAVYRAVLGPADCALHMLGPTGAGKSEKAALAQQHFGAGLDARHLPGSWSSTGNSLEALAFTAKDALLTIDDFAPAGATADIQRYHKEADRVFRSQGNNSGRGRCRIDGSPRAAKPPRGLILSTGEDLPKGQSLRARLLTLELAPGEMDWARLTACQRDAAAGSYAAALAGYLRWLAPNYSAIRDNLRTETAEQRARLHAVEMHARTPGILADLVVGWRYWLDYALAVGAIDQAQRKALARRAWAGLLETGSRQAEHIQAAEPTGLFLRLLAGAIASGRAHVADAEGAEPTLDGPPSAWGWRLKTISAGEYMRDEWQPQGKRIGWLADGLLYLDPNAAYAEAFELARQQGDCLPVTSRTLWTRMKEKGLLADRDESRQRNTVRRTLESVRHREVIALYHDVLTCNRPSTPSTSPNTTDANGVQDRSSADRSCGQSAYKTVHNDRPQDQTTVHRTNGTGVPGLYRQDDSEVL